jgi:replication fork clamp-binding protein CrfC
MQKTLAAFASEIVPRRTSQNCSLPQQGTHWDRKNTRQPATAETIRLASNIHFRSAQRRHAFYVQSKDSPNSQMQTETLNTHSDQVKGAKRQTWHNRNTTIDTIPKCKVFRKMSKW